MRTTNPVLRRWTHGTFSVLWLAGAGVFVLKHFFQVAGDFGVTPHPWQPRLLVIHGIVAVLATFLFGWISGDHVATTWRRGVDRASGLWLLLLIGILIVTGFAAFFLVNDSIRAANGTIHEILGLLLMLPWIVHLLGGRPKRR